MFDIIFVLCIIITLAVFALPTRQADATENHLTTDATDATDTAERIMDMLERGQKAVL